MESYSIAGKPLLFRGAGIVQAYIIQSYGMAVYRKRYLQHAAKALPEADETDETTWLSGCRNDNTPVTHDNGTILYAFDLLARFLDFSKQFSELPVFDGLYF